MTDYFTSKNRHTTTLYSFTKWVIVAFAARCARRVQPLYDGIHFKLIEDILNTIETSFTNGWDNRVVSNYGANTLIKHAREISTEPYSSIVLAVGYASAALATASQMSRDRSQIIRQASKAAEFTKLAMDHYLSNSGLSSLLIWNDIDILKRKCTGSSWTDQRTVSAKIFGELWPWGVPDGWPVS